MPAYVQDVATYTTTAGNKTAAITPAVGNLLVVCAGVASLPTLPTIADDRGGTYSLVAWSTRPAGGGSPSGIWVRNQLVASAVLHTVTMSSSGDGGGGLDVLELSGFVVGGLGTVRSWGQRSAINAAAIPDVSLNHTAEPTGLIVAFLTPSDNPATATTPTGYTNRQNLGFATPVTGMRVETRDSGETTGTITWGAAETSGSNTVAVEFFAGGISEPVPFVPAALPLNRHVRSLIGPPILVEMPDPGTAGATIVTSGSSSDRSMGRQAAAATVFALSGSSSSRGVDRQSAAALVQVNIGSSSARATDRQTGAGVAVVITGSSSSRAVNRQQASSVAIRTASGTDRSRGRQSAASLAIELVSSAARSVGRQAANALSIALGSSQSRARNRENAAATVIVLAGSSSARSGSRTAANSSVVAPGAVTVEAPTMQPLAIRQRIGLGPILVTEQNDTGATPAAAAIVVSGSSSSRASSRSTASSLAIVYANPNLLTAAEQQMEPGAIANSVWLPNEAGSGSGVAVSDETAPANVSAGVQSLKVTNPGLGTGYGAAYLSRTVPVSDSITYRLAGDVKRTSGATSLGFDLYGYNGAFGFIATTNGAPFTPTGSFARYDTAVTPTPGAAFVRFANSSVAANTWYLDEAYLSGINAHRGRARERTTAPTVIVLAGLSVARVQSRARAQALRIVSALSSTDRSRGRSVATATTIGAPDGRELASAAVPGELGARGSGAEVGSRSVPADGTTARPTAGGEIGSRAVTGDSSSRKD